MKQPVDVEPDQDVGLSRSRVGLFSMTYDEKLADRVRRAIAKRGRITEKKTFGGLAFLLGGRMCCRVLNDELVVRVGPARYKEALAQPHARRMDFTGKPLTSFVYVAPPGFRSKQGLFKWVGRGVEFASTLPRPRTKRTGPRTRTARTEEDKS